MRKRYGYRRIYVLLLRENWKINRKRVYRLYRQEGLNLRKPIKSEEDQRFKGAREGICIGGERMLVYGLRIGSIVQW